MSSKSLVIGGIIVAVILVVWIVLAQVVAPRIAKRCEGYGVVNYYDIRETNCEQDRLCRSKPLPCPDPGGNCGIAGPATACESILPF